MEGAALGLAVRASVVNEFATFRTQTTSEKAALERKFPLGPQKTETNHAMLRG